MNNKIIIATIKKWNILETKKFILQNPEKNIYLITDKKDLTLKKVKEINPRYIFFPHWSWKIPKKITENYECIAFHMTDLPFGRGGSPLQNLIIRGFKETKISAIKADKEIDSGPVYLKRDLSLEGTANEIFKRTAKIIFNEMIPYIIKNEPQPIIQKGKIVMFKRRKPEESNIAKLDEINKVYDYIRMLDVEGYPSAFIETDTLKIKFSNAKLKEDFITAKAKIKLRDLYK